MVQKISYSFKKISSTIYMLFIKGYLFIFPGCGFTVEMIRKSLIIKFNVKKSYRMEKLNILKQKSCYLQHLCVKNKNPTIMPK